MTLCLQVILRQGSNVFFLSDTHNIDAASPLRQSKVLCVKDFEVCVIPTSVEFLQQHFQGLATIVCHQSCHILQDERLCGSCADCPYHRLQHSYARIFCAKSLAQAAKALAWKASCVQMCFWQSRMLSVEDVVEELFGLVVRHDEIRIGILKSESKS